MECFSINRIMANLLTTSRIFCCLLRMTDTPFPLAMTVRQLLDLDSVKSLIFRTAYYRLKKVQTYGVTKAS